MSHSWQRLLGAATLGAVVAMAAAAAIGLAVIYGGLFDTRSDTPHLQAVAWATHSTLLNSVRRRAQDVTAPESFSAYEVLQGMRAYDQRCAACHGGPGVDRAPWAGAITPTPPYLLDAARRWSKGELFFIVDHGVKMTAMPAWGEVMPKRDVWNLVAFLEAMPTISAADYRHMRAVQAVTPPVAPPPVPPAALLNP